MAIGTRVVQVTNIAPQATKDQMQTLFGYLGKIEDIRLYPTIRDVSCPVQSRICYIKFVDPVTVGIAQHMTNTVFIDRALIVIPVPSGDIPDEYFALEMTRNGAIVPGLCPSEPNLPANVVNQMINVGSKQVIITIDPKLEARGLPQYPALPSNYDSRKIEEIRRTVLMLNIEPSVTAEDVIEFFTGSGEVKYLRQCSRASDDSTNMLVEFSDQPSVVEALELNGKDLKGRSADIIHSLQAIVKPQAKSNEAAQREIEEAMSRVKEAQNLISATIDPVIGMLSKDKRSTRRSRSRSRGRRRRSRSRSRSRRRSRSKHRSRRSSRSRSRRRSRSRDRRRRSKSRSKRRSRSKSRPRRSRSKGRAHRSRSKSERRERHKSKEKAKSPEKLKEREKKSKERERSKEKDRPRTPPEPKPEKLTDKESANDGEEKRSTRKRSLSPSRKRSRSRERDRKRSRSKERRRERSKSRGGRRSSRRRSRSRSRDRKRDRKERKERSPSGQKPSRNYDDEDRGYESKKDEKVEQSVENSGKESPEKSDNMDISNSP